MPIGNKPRRKSWRIPLGWRSLREFRMRAEVPGSPTHSTGGSVFWTICTSMAAAGIVKLSGPAVWRSGARRNRWRGRRKPPLPAGDRAKLQQLFSHLRGVGLDVPPAARPG
jgi:hypothetical protein